MNLRIYTYTNKGGKQINEDYLDYFTDPTKSVFVLADGLGAHGNGDLASNLVVRSMISFLKEKPVVNLDILKEAFNKANEELLQDQGSKKLPNMKTTAVALAISNDKAIWGHLGDSRLYYLSNNELSEVTSDHSVSYKKYRMGEISYKDINTDDDRASLLGAFGNKERCIPELIEMPQVIKQGDAFLLCSDGFWEYVYDEEILIDFLKSETPKQWADHMLLRHIQRTKPMNDNYSLIAVFVEQDS
jgi:serine/threonine protein phosphatase PrpC